MASSVGVVLWSRAHLFRTQPFRGMFTSRKNDYSKPNWLRVGLAFGTTVALWVSLSMQYDKDMKEYKRRNGLS
uniref:NADH dehydrogenase [ubiquinone] 1 subunit C1, mitochondrial n=1 Tax=Myxine glutinosa TaxID=7769 RepID=UPI00358EE390